MFRSVLSLSLVSVQIFWRDRFFWFSLFFFMMGGGLAVLASEWGVAEFDKIFFDVSEFFFHVPGNFIALFYGAKVLAESFSEGEPDLFVSGCYSRLSWLLGKYLGVCGGLLLLGFCCLVYWCVLCFLFQFPFSFLWNFFGLILGWLVSGSLGFFFGSFTSLAVAFFSSVCVWSFGTSVATLSDILPKNSAPLLKIFLDYGALFFDLQRFFIENNHQVWLVVLFSFVLQGLFFGLGYMAFEKKDLV